MPLPSAPPSSPKNTPRKILHAAREILAEFEEYAPPLDRLLHRYYKERRWLGSGDRRAIGVVIYSLMRQWAMLDWHLQQAALPLNALNRLALWHLLAQPLLNDSVLLDLDWLLPDGPDREIESLLEIAHHVDPSVYPAWVATNCPEWLAADLQQVFGDGFAVEMAALNQPAGVDLRVNTRRRDRATWLRDLQSHDWAAVPTPLSPFGIRLPERFNFNDLPAIQDGWLEVQDEAAQIAASLVGAKAGMRVLDLCAGAGGKALALADRMEGKGQLLLTDIDPGKLQRAKQRLSRADVQNAQIRLLSASGDGDGEGLSDAWLRRQTAKFDRVLVDSPCSGTGTWRRNPDARWRLSAGDIEELIALQRDLLTRAAPLVKAGGWLIYATCSILPAENQQQADWFAAQALAGDFRPLQPAEWLAEVPELAPIAPQLLAEQGDQGFVLTPARHGTDGFYIMAWARAAV